MVQTVLVVVLCALLGMFIFSLVGMILGCAVIWPTSNLCGLAGPIYGGPFGLIVGAIAGWMIARPASGSA
jgi:hypothetical protein